MNIFKKHINCKGHVILLLIFVIVILLSLTVFNVSAEVRINEFMADNYSIFPDMIDFDDYTDWIEIYNDSANPVDMSNYFLSDNLDYTFKWSFPPGLILPSQSYYIVRADGFNAYPGEQHARQNWPFDSYSTTNSHSNFKLSKNGESICLSKAVPGSSNSIIDFGSSWRYYDYDVPPPPHWNNLLFDDSQWDYGVAEFGYGDGDETTIINYGSDPDSKIMTAYFRYSFTIDTPADIQRLNVHAHFDDGIIVYLNGVEIAQSNMPYGEINHDTGAIISVDDNQSEEYLVYSANLEQGDNVIAVEVHQFDPSSSDLSFDLELFMETYSNIAIIDSVSYPAQFSNISYGRINNTNNWGFFRTSTPMQENDSNIVNNFTALAEVEYSLAGGYYNGTQILELDHSIIDGNIYYTLNGDTPSSESLLYTNPISIDRTEVISARFIAPGNLPGPIRRETYLFNESTTLPVISVMADNEGLWDDELGIYQNNYKQREIPVRLEYFVDQQRVLAANLGARIGGMNIWRFAQKPLTLYARNKYGTEFLEGAIFPNREFSIFSKLVLRNGGDDFPSTLLRDATAEAIVSGKMNNGIMAYQPCVVFLNGDYWGIHNIREKFDRNYFIENFGANYEYVDHLSYGYTYSYLRALQAETGNAKPYTDLLNFVETNTLSDDSNYDFVYNQVDIDSYIDYVIIESYVGNTSWHHNREWWRDRSGDNKWKWLIPDLDRGFGANPEINILNAINRYDNLLNGLLENVSFKIRFAQRSMSHINNTFSVLRINAIMDSLAGNIADEIPRHALKWGESGGVQSFEQWQTDLALMKDFANVRPAIMINQLTEFFGNNYELASVNLQINNQDAGTISIEGVNANLQHPGQYFKLLPLTLKALPQPGYAFTGWDDGNIDSERVLSLTDNISIMAYFAPAADFFEMPSEINSNLVLTSEVGRYYANESINVSAGVTLTIEAGVEILFSNNVDLIINGKLVVSGSEGSPVKMLPNSDAGCENWGSICFKESPDTSRISHLTIRGATNGKIPVDEKSAISGYNANIILDHLDMDEVNFPIFTQFGSTTLRNSRIHTDVTCDFINIKYGDGLVENSTFIGNLSPDTDAIDYDQVIDGIIRNNRFYSFQGFNCDAIDIGEQSQNILISENKIYNSSDKGISVGQQSTVEVRRNIIVGCNIGIAVKDSNSYAFIDQNTFYGNNVSVAVFEKNLGAGGGNADVTNSIFASSTYQPYIVDELSQLSISHCLSNTVEIPGFSNVVADPKFVLPGLYNLELLPDSPSIDGGDPAHDLDDDGSFADIGGYYTYSDNDFPFTNFNASNDIIINEISFISNEQYNPKDWIELYNSGTTPVNLTGWYLKDSADHVFYFDYNQLIEADKYLVICNNREDFYDYYGTVENIAGDMMFGLNSISDGIRLYDKYDTVADSVAYTNQSPWPEIQDSSAFSIELLNTEFDNRLAENWARPLVAGGTPGQKNSTYYVPTPPEVTIQSFKLFQNYPNPFNNLTQIRFEIPSDQNVSITIYNIIGQKVARIMNRRLLAGYHEVLFDASYYASGIYFYRFESESFNQVKKMVLIK
jgi:CotH kinase protein/Lamin Tail Domain/Chitobiase/beta-hexosaminidase C-terminal domain/Secretion system C-terminal sorting domain/Right handed beta helix region